MTVQALVVGSFGLDTQQTPFGSVKDAVGGSAPYAALGAHFFAKTAVVGSVGTDYPKGFLDELQSRGIDTSGLQFSPKPSFRWFAEYGFDVNVRKEHVEINALADLKPELPEQFKRVSHLFLANENPAKQQQFLELFQKKPKLVMADTIRLWIQHNRQAVLDLVLKADFMLLNDSEARELFQTPQLSKAAQEILKLNSDFAVIKKGEDGAVLFSRKGFFAVPGYPLEIAKDPTGCGDCFAGAMAGYLAKQEDWSEKTVRKALVVANAVASFNAEEFSCKRLLEISTKDIRARVSEFKEFVRF